LQKKKTFLLILLGLLAVVGMVVSIFLTKEITKSVEETPPTQEEAPKEEPKEPVVPEEPEQLNENEKVVEEPKKSPESIYQVPQVDKKEISVSEAKHYEQQARAKFRELRFLEGANLLEPVTKEYSDEGAGALLHQLYFEGSLLANVVPPPDRAYTGEIAEGEGVYNIMNAIRDPEMLLLGAIGLDDIERGKVILNKQSLNPIFFGQVFIQEKTVNEGDMLKEVHILYPEVKTLHQIHFVIEGYHLYAYIMEYPDGTAKVHSLQEVNKDTTPYKTIREWEELFKELDIKPTSEREHRY